MHGIPQMRASLGTAGPVLCFAVALAFGPPTSAQVSDVRFDAVRLLMRTGDYGAGPV